MTRFSAPFKIKQAFSETTVASVDATGKLSVSGIVSAAGGLSLTTTVTAAASGGGTGNPVPTSAATYAEVDVNGSTYLVALFNKED